MKRNEKKPKDADKESQIGIGTTPMSEIESHPLQPFLPSNAKVLFLGSFPPSRKRWCMDFFYPNFINDHWRIEGAIFYGDRNHFVDVENHTFKLSSILPFLEEKGIAIYDTATKIRRLRDNASDKYLEIVEATDIHALLNLIPECRIIAVTGEKAATALCERLETEAIPKVNEPTSISCLIQGKERKLELWRLPSSSRAYPLAFDKKVEAYRKMFEAAGMI